ncbi:hypothetical protein XA68_12195 [Ophiocordyceps unilateralis]|uniref:NAD(P)-binding domain-containing protein n=1 Tax=Ophiocordyceps unilateralis TaxID=268505 RepID=A0A2A9PF89_OPHUN|nr:hypothetical protein XA68_12195 [Ophiocordyceps unilateralis]
MSAPSAVVIGSTGLVGGHILSALLASTAYQPVQTITRREPKPPMQQQQQQEVRSVVDADSSRWPAALSGISPTPTTVFSALGTTRAAAGGLDQQWKIDHDLNIELARAAKAAGARTFVFVSAAGTRGALAGRAPYNKMKNGVEDAVRDLAFDHAVIIKPGLILGAREQQRTMESLFQRLAHAVGYVSASARDAFAQDAQVIGRAAVSAARLVDQGKAPGSFWLVEAADIVKLGREQWPLAEEEARA